MYFGMKSNDITKDRLEYYTSRRSMATELIVTDGMEDGASCPTFPRSGGGGSPPGTAGTFSGTETQTNLEGKLLIAVEQARGRMTDTDFAKESTALVKSSLKFEMATKIMSNATRLKDVLIPLTQNHFRSFVLRPTL